MTDPFIQDLKDLLGDELLQPVQPEDITIMRLMAETGWGHNRAKKRIADLEAEGKLVSAGFRRASNGHRLQAWRKVEPESPRA